MREVSQEAERAKSEEIAGLPIEIVGVDGGPWIGASGSCLQGHEKTFLCGRLRGCAGENAQN